MRECALTSLKNEGGLLTEQVIRSINNKMEEVTQKSEWQCVFGQQFAMCLEFERNSMLYFCIGNTAFVLYRCVKELTPAKFHNQ
ncbi:hypothetical protein OESDEN_13335 [Oesophagostomum dentatum]|uniref:Dynein light chain n=1 Tax=Oesophagostomum dentatum TaxID=61180 RepID=A0A0B1SSM5_OESDE|nr:hypothetical protein OESDEN_13335 [Oesophagostomum dentatum]